MKYTIDTEKKTIEFTSLSSSEIIELAKQYKGFTFICKPDVINITGGTVITPYRQNPYVPFSQPYYGDLGNQFGGTTVGGWKFGSTTTNHCQGGATLSTFSGTAKC